jgi:hypothetical protein
VIKAKLDHKKDICEIDVRGKLPEITNEVATIIENVYEALDEPYKALYRHALIMAIEDGQLLGEGDNGDEC